MKLFLFFSPLEIYEVEPNEFETKTRPSCNENRGFHYSIDISFSADRCFYDSSTNRWSRLILQLKIFFFTSFVQTFATNNRNSYYYFIYLHFSLLTRCFDAVQSKLNHHNHAHHTVSLLQMSRSKFSRILILYTSLSRHKATRKLLHTQTRIDTRALSFRNNCKYFLKRDGDFSNIYTYIYVSDQLSGHAMLHYLQRPVEKL